jgi:predicted deacylase
MIKQNIKTRTLADGTQLSIPVFHFHGSDKNAPSVYIQSGIHGAEVQGYLVALKLIEYFETYPPKGDVNIVPIANPYGLNCKIGYHTFGRFDPTTGDNWNRNYEDLTGTVDSFLSDCKDCPFDTLVPLFKKKLQESLAEKLGERHSYHKKLALQLQSLSSSADIILDLHCDTLSVPHIYCPSYALNSVINFGIPFIVEIPHTFGGALDEASFCPWVALMEKYNAYHGIKLNCPIETFTIELGNQELIDPDHAYKQLPAILNYLAAKGVCDQKNISIDRKLPIYSCALKDFITIYAASGGLILQHPKLGSSTKAKETLMSLNTPSSWEHVKNIKNFIHDSSLSITISHDSIPISRSMSSVIHEGMALMKVMTRYRKIN